MRLTFTCPPLPTTSNSGIARTEGIYRLTLVANTRWLVEGSVSEPAAAIASTYKNKRFYSFGISKSLRSSGSAGLTHSDRCTGKRCILSVGNFFVVRPVQSLYTIGRFLIDSASNQIIRQGGGLLDDGQHRDHD